MKSLYKLILTLLILGLTASVYAGEMTLRAYYPSPFGAYDRLRFVPRNELVGGCDADQVGTLYIRNTDELPMLCVDQGGGNYDWGLIPGVWRQNGDEIFLTDGASNPDLLIGIGDSTPDAFLEISASGQNDDLLLLSSDDGSDGDILIVQNDGRMGLGLTADLDHQLEVDGDIEIVSDDADSKLRFHDPGDNWYSMGIDQDDGNFKINFGANVGDAVHFVLTPAGNVEIGGALKVKVDGTNEGDLKVEYVPGTNPGYYATYAHRGK